MLGTGARQHLERYWQLSLRFFRESDYALAAFFAITLIEEVGKIVILGNAKLGSELDRKIEKGFVITPKSTPMPSTQPSL